MDCPYKSIGLIKDRCVNGCGPLEAIYSHSGLSHNEAIYSLKNVLLTYAAIGLSDKARDDGLVVRSFATRLRNRVGKSLPEGLNQYITSVDQTIELEEKSHVSLEHYLYASGQMGSNIFNLATPPGSSYDKAFVAEAGSLSTQLMIMGDMSKDLPEDMKSGKYNPLKNPEVRPRFNDLYSNVKDGLTNLISKTKIESVFNYKGRNICSDKRGKCTRDDVALVGFTAFVGYLIAAPPTFNYLFGKYCATYAMPTDMSYIDYWIATYTNFWNAIVGIGCTDVCPVLYCASSSNREVENLIKAAEEKAKQTLEEREEEYKEDSRKGA